MVHHVGARPAGRPAEASLVLRHRYAATISKALRDTQAD